ncbi:hypothetical protein SKAU_G00356210 [Synaphobranchus kaupii]|uniref:Uncharacterized protein n=1 Tax=Synaphobranchus kaupii TaxID=118154 RepID=A0A9Q1IFN1_SYNKA|nr:hypothetical protein SKAU_G00356210 [Synaphobranchus kaupii]
MSLGLRRFVRCEDRLVCRGETKTQQGADPAPCGKREGGERAKHVFPVPSIWRETPSLHHSSARSGAPTRSSRVQGCEHSAVAEMACRNGMRGPGNSEIQGVSGRGYIAYSGCQPTPRPCFSSDGTELGATGMPGGCYCITP